jgi:hypothetical protein
MFGTDETTPGGDQVTTATEIIPTSTATCWNDR